MTSRSAEWQGCRDVENLIAILLGIDQCCKVIKVQAWNHGSRERIFAEAADQARAITELHAELIAMWDRLYYLARCPEEDQP